MSIITRQKSKTGIMPEIPDEDVGEDTELTIDEKLNKLLNNTKDMTAIKKDLKKISSSVKDLTADVAELKKNTDTIPEITKQLKELQTGFNNLKNENAKDKKSISDITRRVTEIEEENTELKRELNSLKTKTRHETNMDERQIEDRVTQQIQRQHDRSSLLIEGVYENQHESLTNIVKQIAHDASIQVLDRDVVEVFRLGRFNQKEKRPRSIKVTFATRTMRNNIFKNRMTIKNNPACENIWVNECLDEKQKKNRTEVKAVVDLAVSLGKEARAVGESAIISGIRYEHQVLHTLPTEISLEKAFTRELHDRIYFNSEHSVLSSFHPVEIEFENNGFHNLEQAYQYKRAKKAKNQEVQQFILNNPDPRACKAAAKKIVDDDKWNEERDEVMESLVEIKSRIPKVKSFLLKTGDKELVEATGDMHWACGATFRSKKCQSNKTTGKNKLGKIWMERRAIIRAELTPADDTPDSDSEKDDQTRDDMPPLEDN